MNVLKILTLTTCAVLAAEEGTLLSQANEGFETLQGMHPLESIRHITTYEEIPIFGGSELREQMLVEQRAVSQKRSQLE